MHWTMDLLSKVLRTETPGEWWGVCPADATVETDGWRFWNSE